jgi:DNA modification methylase
LAELTKKGASKPALSPAPPHNLSARARANGTAQTRLAVEYREIDTLKLDPNNPREHSSKRIGQIATSIEAFGFNVPVLIDASSKIIAGHGRILACRKLGWLEVPTVRLDNLTEAQAKAFMIADNRLTETSTWNERVLALNLKELSVLNLDFNLEATGFDMGEIDIKIEDLDGDQTEPEPEDVLPSLGPPVSRLGDMWILGKHRLLCGNSLDEASYKILLQNDRAAVVVTDPPFNVPIDGHVSGLGSIQHREFAMASGEMSEIEFSEFLTKLCKLLAMNSVDGSLHYLFMDWRHLDELLAAGKATYSELKNICVWVKTNAGMGSLYRSQHEFVAVFKSGKGQHWNNIQLGRFGRHRSNVWTYPGMTSVRRSSDEGDLLSLHPTVKPLALVVDVLLDASGRNDIVLDPFLGSGTTLIAAERVGRRCCAIELDPAYVDVAVRRWQRWTGELARHSESGRTFDECAATTEQGHV